MIRYLTAPPQTMSDTTRWAWECVAPDGVEGDGWHVCVDNPLGRARARWWNGTTVRHADGIPGPARKVLQVRDVGPWRTEADRGAML